MSDKEPTSAQPALAAVETAPAEPPPTTESSEAFQKPGDASHDANRADAAKAGSAKNGKDADADESEGASAGAKPKRTTPYVNPARFKTGGVQREKLTPEALSERMDRIRLNNEKIKERRATVQADEQAFRASQSAQRAKDAASRRIQAGIDANRAANARRKMDKVGVREWDSNKKGISVNANLNTAANRNGGFTAGADDEGPKDEKVEEATPAPASGPGDEGERGRGKGRGVERARGRGRSGRRGGRGGGEFGRGKPPHERARPQDKAQEKEEKESEWGTGADEWGTTTCSAVAAEDDWGTGVIADKDPWGVMPETPTVDSGQKS